MLVMSYTTQKQDGISIPITYNLEQKKEPHQYAALNMSLVVSFVLILF